MRGGRRRIFLDGINRIDRLEQDKTSDRPDVPCAPGRGEALMTQIKALEKLHGLGTS